MCCSVFPSISPCLIPTTAVRERRQGAVVTFGGPSGALQPLADASESANQCGLGIGTERGVTTVTISNCKNLQVTNSYFFLAVYFAC